MYCINRVCRWSFTVLFLLTAGSLAGADWYTNYQHTDNGLTAYFNFNGNDTIRIRDQVVQKNAVGTDVTSITGWYPAAGYTLDGKGFKIEDSRKVDECKDFTVVFHAKISGSGYAILKKGVFGLQFAEDKVFCYLAGARGDMTLSAGNNQSESFHTWVITVNGLDARVYCDGKVVGKRKLPTTVNTNSEALLIGNSDGWKKSNPTGRLALLRIYNKALSEKEIISISSELARGQVPAPDGSLALQLPMGARNVFIGDDISYEKKELAWHFNGSSSGIKLPVYPELQQPIAALTAGAWIKPERTMPKSLNEQGYIISANNGRHSGWSIGTYYHNGLNVTLRTDKGYYTASVSHVLKPHIWQHVAFVYDGTEIRIFVDGKPVGQSVKAEGKIIPFRKNIHIGKAADRNGMYFMGAIDEVRILRSAIALQKDPDTGKLITQKAGNHDSTALPEPLPRLRDMEKQQPIGKTLCDFEDLSGWTVSYYKNISEAAFCRSNDDRLFGDYTGKLTLQAGVHFDPAKKLVSIAPPAPLTINEEFDYISLYISAANWTKPTGAKLNVEIVDADGKIHTIPMQSSEIPFIYWTGWTVMIKKTPQTVKIPAKLTRLTFYNFGGMKPEVYYLDNLAVHKLAPELPEKAAVKIPSWTDIGAPTVPTASMPTLENNAPARPARLTVQGNSYIFTMQNADDKIVYKYTPKTGKLSDITLSFNGNPEFQPMKNGGLAFVSPQGVELPLESPEITARLISIQAGNDQVTADWQYYFKNQALARAQIGLSAQGKTLSIKLSGSDGKVWQVKTGSAAIKTPVRLTTVPYWVIRAKKVNDPAILYSEKMLLSAFVDIYRSHASALVGGSGKLDDNTYQINGGALYQRKTDGTRNAVNEVIHLTASSKVSEVLPHIANPANPTLDITSRGIWVTRMWYDKMPLMDYFPRHYQMWELIHRYGVRNLMIRDHQSLGRQYSPKRRGGYDSNLESILPDIGGDAAAEEYFRKCTENLGYRMGLYTNFTLLPAIGSKETTFDRMTLNSDGDIRYGATTARMCKYAYILDIQSRINALLKSKFTLTCSYPDQYTCRAPWAYTDSDVRVPEAGKFSPVIRVLAKCLIVEQQDFQVTLSEGINQWILAGYCDSYAQTGSPEDPVFPEFQLRKLHPLSNDTGAHLQIITSNAPDAVDRLLTLTFANGTIGHLYGTWSGKPQTRIKPETLKSYYMVKQLQPYYAGGVPVKTIEYHLNGKYLTAAEVIAADAVNHNQLKIVYQNGTVVYANANKNKDYPIKFKGKTIVLPPSGYYVKAPGQALSYSVKINGHRADYSTGNEYIYANGNGVLTDFGTIKCKNAYAALFENDRLEIIPVPFIKPETIELDLSKIPFKNAQTLQKLDRHGKVISQEVLPVDNSETLQLNIDGSCFSYKIF